MPRETAWQRGLQALDAEAQVGAWLDIRGAVAQRQKRPAVRMETRCAASRCLGRHVTGEFLQTACAARYRGGLLVAPDSLERDWLGWAGQPAWLCPYGLRRAGSVGGGRSARIGWRPMRTSEEPPCRLTRWLSRAARTVERRTFFDPAPGCRCGISRRRASRFSHRWNRRGWRHARLSAGGGRVLGGGSGCRPWFRPLEDFASDEAEQTKLYWTDDRISTGANPLQLGSNNSGKAVGGSTVHFAMVSLRFRPSGFGRAACWAMARTGRSTGGRCGRTTPRSSRR